MIPFDTCACLLSRGFRWSCPTQVALACTRTAVQTRELSAIKIKSIGHVKVDPDDAERVQNVIQNGFIIRRLCRRSPGGVLP